MIDSKLITLLKKLNSNEFKEFEKFAASPYHARGRDFTSLYKALKQFYPGFDSNKFTKEFLFKKLYPSAKYSPEVSDHKLRMIFTAMYKLCMDFLIQNELNKDVQRKQFYLLNQLRLKKLNKEFEKVFAESTHENKLLKGSVTDFSNKYFFMSELKNYLIEKDDYANLFEASFAMREYSVISALVSCFKHEAERTVTGAYNLKARHTLMRSLVESLDIEKLLRKMEINNDRFYPFVNIYHTAYKMEKHNDIEYFYKMKALLNEHQNIFGTMEKFALWVMMETYCMSNQTASPDAVLTRELFILYNEMLESGIYKAGPNENFNIARFRNMVKTAAKLSEFEWLENFINIYSAELDPRHKDDMKNYSLALLLLEKNNFEAALESIMKVKFEYFQYKIDVRIALLKIYYELNYYEQVYSTVDTTLHFLKNSEQFSLNQRNAARNFTKYLKSLALLKENDADLNEVQYVKSLIDCEKRITHQEWLLKKADELE